MVVISANNNCCSTRTCSYFMMLLERWPTQSDITSTNRLVCWALELLNWLHFSSVF